MILAVGTQGGLTQAELASWVFGVFFLNGVLTVVACWVYRQPLAFFWTIPGTVLVGPALGHLRWPEVVGAFFATGLLMLVLGLTGWVRRVMNLIPMPIVMGMVAGVFLRFGTDLVRALGADVARGRPDGAGVPAAERSPRRSAGGFRRSSARWWSVRSPSRCRAGSIRGPAATQWIAAPVLQVPQWSVQAMVELVVPLAITVLVVQNGQGVAVLRAAGHDAPVNMITIACGAWSLLAAGVGAVSTCLTGPTNALLAASGERSRHYTAGIVCGLLAMVFGLLAPLFTRLMLATPGRLHRRARRAGDAPGAAGGVRHCVQQPVHARRAGHLHRHGRRRHDLQHRRRLLGARRGDRRVAPARAARLRRTRSLRGVSGG